MQDKWMTNENKTMWFKEYDTRDGMSQDVSNETSEHVRNDDLNDKKAD